MTYIVLFIEKEYNHLMDAADLTDGGTKVFGDIVIAETEKEGDVKKLIKDRIVAAYCNGNVAIKKGIKSLSNGETFMTANYFKEYSRLITETKDARDRWLI